MADIIHQLYENKTYPPMSHPSSDPAVSAVAAAMAGLDVPHPRHARILEIGCSTGHNLIPLAMRWPESRFTGIDLTENSIQEARERANQVGLTNIRFHTADLREFGPADGSFDFIIAHGFLSWVPDEVKITLFDFCQKHLSPSGIATISFNVECGWLPRLTVIAKVKAILNAGAEDEISALAILKSVTPPGDPEHAIIDDMLAKGAAILAFDDFGPVNDPWSLDDFVLTAAGARLRWLGESDPAENFPAALDDAAFTELQRRESDPLQIQLAIDEIVRRTFRSTVLCRDDAPVTGKISAEKLLEFSYRAGNPPSDPAARKLYDAICSFAPACVPWDVIAPVHDQTAVAHLVFEGISRGWWKPRIEPVSYPAVSAEFPKLDGFRLLCSRLNLPVVDAWHQPCTFPIVHYQILTAMDGRLKVDELAELSKRLCPELAFEPWLCHLAKRGFFTE